LRLEQLLSEAREFWVVSGAAIDLQDPQVGLAIAQEAPLMLSWP